MYHSHCCPGNLPLFVGDIGGFMGLLIGGSLISVVELLDLVIYSAAMKVVHRARSLWTNVDKYME